MDRLIMVIATGLGLGYLPKAPGTWGTLLALPIHYLIVQLSLQGYISSIAIIIVLAVLTAGSFMIRDRCLWYCLLHRWGAPASWASVYRYVEVNPLLPCTIQLVRKREEAAHHVS